jgi:transmembrane sensor
MKNRPLPAPTQIQSQAIDWFYRQSDGTMTSADHSAFEQWLINPQHAAEYARISQVWSDMDALPLAKMLADVSSVPQRKTRWLDRFRLFSWQSGLAVGAVACSLVLCALYVPLETKDIHTGHQLDTQVVPVTLGDGSRVYANIDTKITVRYSLLKRQVTLAQGEAFFEVAPNTWRPFTVTTPQASVRVVGTSFNVLTLPDTVEVAVRTGHVDVTASSGKVALTAGQMMSVVNHKAIKSASSSDAWSWREGMMVVHDATLEDIMHKLQRYATQTVQFNDTRAMQYRLSGTVDLSSPVEFIHALPSLVPVRVLEKTDGTLMIASRK